MIPHSLMLGVIAVGHACLMVLAINISHGLGIRSRQIERYTLIALAVVGLATIVGAWWLWQHPEPGRWPWLLRLYAGACALVALIGLPGVTIGQKLRRQPEGVSTEIRDLDDPAGLHGEAPEGSRGDAWLFRIPGNEAVRLQVKECRVELPGLPEALDGLNLVHLTDLHMSPAYGRGYFEAVADEAARLEPDLVLCTGDIVEHADSIAWLEPVLGRVRGRHGSFAILGNHDFHYDPERLREALGRTGFEDVDGRWTTVELDGATLAIGGTSAPWGPRLDTAAMPEAEARLVLSHTPDQFYRVAGWDAVDLVLCGHNHGGQIRLPVLGAILMPSLYSRRFDRGFFRSGRTLMHVGQGLGAKHPIRLNCPPELTRIVLRSAAVRDARAADEAAAGAAV